jgi:hypothetical protein
MRAFAGRVVVVVDPAHVQSASTTSALQIQKAIDSTVCGFTDRSVCDCACAAHTDTAERESDGRGQRRRAKLKRPAAAFPPIYAKMIDDDRCSAVDPPLAIGRS